MTAIVVVASLTLLSSFLCSLLEAALYSVSPAQLQVLKAEGVFGARRFARYREHVEEPIAAILTVNTVAHTVGSAVTGAMVGDAYGSAAVGWFAGVFTFLVLFLTEIVPKSVGVRFATRLVPYLALPLQILIAISWPVARPSKMLMSRWMGRHEGGGATEAEVIALSRMAVESGAMTSREVRWVENALGLDKISAKDLMTPRIVVRSVPVERRVRELADELRTMQNSRLPVYEGGDTDRLVGVVHRRDLFDAVAQGRLDATVRDFLRPLDYVPDSMKGPRLLERFIRGKRHMVAVIDEYGGFEGIVTLEDVFECLLGQEIVDEHDEHVDMQELARLRARRRGSVGGDGPGSDPG